VAELKSAGDAPADEELDFDDLFAFTPASAK
jgi:hypothetical protein